MRYLRRLAKRDQVFQWFQKQPPLSKLLECFGVKYQVEREQSASVYSVLSEVQELEAIGALFLTAPGKPEQEYGVIVTDADCAKAGITIKPTSGTTGIQAVDDRHADLVGTKQQFAGLIAEVVARIWEGEQRVRLFAPSAVLGQVALFTKLNTNQRHPDTQEECDKVLAYCAGECTLNDALTRIELTGKLDDKKENCPISAVRPYPT